MKIEKFNKTGHFKLGRTYREIGSTSEKMNDIIRINNESMGYIATISDDDIGFGDRDILFGTIDSDTLLPQEEAILYGNSESQSGLQVFKLKNRGLLLGGVNENDLVLINLNEDFSENWQNFYESDARLNFASMDVDEFGNICITGRYGSGFDIYFLFLDSDGEIDDFMIYNAIDRITSRVIKMITRKNETIVIGQPTGASTEFGGIIF